MKTLGSNFILCTAARGYYEEANGCVVYLEVIILRSYIFFFSVLIII